MAKTLTEAPITTKNARASLPLGVHWKGIDPEVHLGYRKGKHGGTWLVRWRNGKGYRQVPLGSADDAIKEGTLDYRAAIKAARAQVEAARAEAKATAEGPLITIRLVVETYIAERDARDSRRKGRAVTSDAGQRLKRYILGRDAHGTRKAIPAALLADVPLHALKETDLHTWRSELPDTLKATTKQRLINDLKAALNTGYTAYRERLDPKFPDVVKHGLKGVNGHDEEAAPIARDNQILSDAQVAALIGAAGEIDAEQGWGGDLYRLLVVLAATGARFSQVIRMCVSDVQCAQERLMVPVSRKGRGGKRGTTPVPVEETVLDTLLPVTTGRAGDAPLLERWRYRQVSGGTWEKAERRPWQVSSELVRPWHDIRERAKLPEVIPYVLRHSSIVRGIRANLPVRLVAALHDTSVPMIERHYGRWIADGLEDMAAKAVVPLIPKA